MKTTLICLITLLSCRTWAQQPKPISFGEKYEITSTQLSERRTLNIYLPLGYNKADTTKYPVIYLLDGGLDEDFIHVAGLVQFNSFPWVHRVQPSIVVGIVNVDRKRDMSFPTTMKSEKQKYPTAGGSHSYSNTTTPIPPAP